MSNVKYVVETKNFLGGGYKGFRTKKEAQEYAKRKKGSKLKTVKTFERDYNKWLNR